MEQPQACFVLEWNQLSTGGVGRLGVYENSEVSRGASFLGTRQDKVFFLCSFVRSGMHYYYPGFVSLWDTMLVAQGEGSSKDGIYKLWQEGIDGVWVLQVLRTRRRCVFLQVEKEEGV